MSYKRTQLQTVERMAFGGTHYDSFRHAAMFRTYKPYNFGVKSAELFSSKLGSQLINKRFTFMTVAQNNTYVLPGGTDDYEWHLVADAEVDFRITQLLVPEDSYPGKGGLPFKIALDKDFLHEPAVIKLENSNLPLLKILGHPVQLAANSFEFEAELQTGDPNAWIPIEYLMPQRRAIRVSTSVSTELNTKYAGVHFGEMYKLQGWVGSFANKCEFTDKFIRTEISCAKEGRSMPKTMGYSIGGNSYSGSGIGVGYMYHQSFTVRGKKDVIEKGVFVTKMEALLMERTEMDSEMNMEFGQAQKTVDRDSKRPIKVAPGWRQYVKDGHYKEHNGTLSLSEIYEFIAEIFLTRRAFSDRKIKLSSGEPGIEVMNRLIKAEAGEFTYIDTLFLQKRKDPQGYHDNELEYGAQFTKIKMTNGYTLEIIYDPNKDDRQLHPELIPGTNRTREGLCMDIFDFGMTDQKAVDATNSSNITAVMEDGVEEYYSVSNVYDFNTGAIKDGSNARSNNKELGIYRAISRGLCIWDVTRVGRIEFNPVTGSNAYPG
jgi:hypothetical protein